MKNKKTAKAVREAYALSQTKQAKLEQQMTLSLNQTYSNLFQWSE